MRKAQNSRPRAVAACIFAAVTACFLLLNGCADGGRYAAPSYAEGELRCSFVCERDGILLAGELWVSALDPQRAAEPADIAPGRDIVLYFTAPATLAGIELSRRDGVLSIRSGDVELCGDALPPEACDGWLLPVAGLYPADPRCTVAPLAGQVGCLRLTFAATPGVAVVVDERGRPLRLELGDCICSYTE